MRIVIHVDQFYDWQSVPEGLPVAQADIDAKRVKKSLDGRWLMRVPVKTDSHTEIALPEQQIIALIIGDKIRDHVTHSRQQAVATYLSRLVMPQHAHRSWMKHVDVHDDGPDSDLFDEMVSAHVAAGNLDKDDFGDLKEAYLATATADDHGDHLHKHFRMKGDRAARRPAEREGKKRSQ